MIVKKKIWTFLVFWRRKKHSLETKDEKVKGCYILQIDHFTLSDVLLGLINLSHKLQSNNNDLSVLFTVNISYVTTLSIFRRIPNNNKLLETKEQKLTPLLSNEYLDRIEFNIGDRL